MSVSKLADQITDERRQQRSAQQRRLSERVMIVKRPAVDGVPLTELIAAAISWSAATDKPKTMPTSILSDSVLTPEAFGPLQAPSLQ
jgi:hypothetical protein